MIEILKLIEEGETLKSIRTKRELKCYNIMSVYMGESQRLAGYSYSFWDGKKSQTIKQSVLDKMLCTTWSVKN